MKLAARSLTLTFLLAACSADDSGTGLRADNAQAADAGEEDTVADARAATDARPTARPDGSAPADPTPPGDDASATDPTPPGDDASAPTKPVDDASAPTDPVEDASAPVDDASVGGGKRCNTRGGVLCKDGEYCDYGPMDTTCGATDKGGTCKQLPGKLCPQVYKPVCGCDGRTYGNSCSAASVGVSVKHDGACETIVTPGPGQLGVICGGFAGFACPSGQFCNYAPPLGQGCGAIADASGFCQDKPEACLAVYEPVCGCDGNTYGNACNASSAGVTVKSNGACK